MPRTRLFVTDLDRTLIDPEQAVDILDEIAAQKGYVDRHSLVTVAHSRKGLDFDFFDYLEKELHFNQRQIEELTQLALERANPLQLFFDDTQVYLDTIAERQDTTLLILTYGRPRWQNLKLRLSGLDRCPYIITENSDKGSIIASWLQNDRTVPPEHPGLGAEEVIAVDDKISGLKGVKKGYLVDRPGIQTVKENDSIIVVRNLREVLTHEGLEIQ